MDKMRNLKKLNLFSNLFLPFFLFFKHFRSCNVHQINKNRHLKSEFYNLYPLLREDNGKFREYTRNTRMNIETFGDLIMTNFLLSNRF